MFWISRFVERENTSENICSFERAETQCKRGCNFDELFLKEKWCSSTLFLKEKEKEIKARENANHNGDKHRFVLHQILRPHFDERTLFLNSLPSLRRFYCIVGVALTTVLSSRDVMISQI